MLYRLISVTLFLRISVVSSYKQIPGEKSNNHNVGFKSFQIPVDIKNHIYLSKRLYLDMQRLFVICVVTAHVDKLNSFLLKML